MGRSKGDEAFRWTEEQVAFLRAMFLDGRSAKAIAAAMSRKYGVRQTRNSICGKLYRLGIKRFSPQMLQERKVRAERNRQVAAERRVRVAAKRKPEPLVIPKTEPVPKGPLREFPDAKGCKWIHGDPAGSWQACGHERTNSPYCAYHAKASVSPNSSSGPKPVSLPSTRVGTSLYSRILPVDQPQALSLPLKAVLLP